MALFLEQLLITLHLWIPPILLCLSFLFGIFIALYSLPHDLYADNKIIDGRGTCSNYISLYDDDLVDGVGISVCSFLGLLIIGYFKLVLKQTFYESAHNMWILFIFIFISTYFIYWKMSPTSKENILIKLIYWTLLFLILPVTALYIYEVFLNPHIILCSTNCMRYIFLIYSIMVGVNIIDFFLHSLNNSIAPKYNQLLMVMQLFCFCLLAVLIVNLFDNMPNVLPEILIKHSPEYAFIISISIVAMCSLLIAINLSALYGIYGNLTRGMSATLIPCSLFVFLLCGAKIVSYVAVTREIKSDMNHTSIKTIKLYKD